MGESRGVVTLVGAGPGDPGLLTLHGVAALRAADVVLYDSLVDPCVLDHVRPDAERISAGKRAGHCVMSQAEIHEQLVRHARLGRRVVRLKGGDPYVFGRGAEEVEALRAAGIDARVIPGVTAGVGASCYAGIPVTHREVASAVAFVTGHDDPASGGSRIDWNALARFPGTLVIYMGVTRLAAIRDRLIASGKPEETPAAFIHRGSLPDQRVIVSTLRDLPETVRRESGRAPALIVVGEVVGRRPDLNWFERLPLFGQRILVTRPRAEGLQAVDRLRSLGAEAILAPMVEIRPMDDSQPIDDAIGRLASYDWIVFTSSNGVRGLMDRVAAIGADSRVFGPLKIAAIGPATAETLAGYHLRADLIAESYVSESLADAMAGKVGGRRVLLIQADRGRAVLREALSRVAHVDRLPTYENLDADSLAPEVAERLAEGSVDWITVTSSAIAERLHVLLPPAARDRVGSTIRLASLSPLTTQALSRLGWAVAVEAESATWDALVDAISTRVAADGPGRVDDSTGAPL
jgi:uroporphyrinogen III methyltransferase/synthase